MSPRKPDPLWKSSTGTPLFASTSGKHNAASTGATTNLFGCGTFGTSPVAGSLGTSPFTPTNTKQPPVTTGTSNPAYSVSRKEGLWGEIAKFQSITAMLAYEDASLEELRVQDYQQHRKGAGTSGQTTCGAPVVPAGFLGKPIMTEQTGSAFGGGTGTFGTGMTQPATGPFEREKGVTDTGTGTNPSPPRYLKSPSPVVDHGKLERVEELLRRSLLGGEIVDTRFHLFSARSSHSGRVMKPRVLCVNNSLLASSSKYFLDLLSSDANPSNRSLVDLTGGNDVPDSAEFDDYGYESDSDLDEDGDELSEDVHESIGKETMGNKESSNQSTILLRSLGSRHILVKDTAFRTWYTLLNYLYTGKFSFLSPSSTVPGTLRGPPTSPIDGPRCSAKSMYRLASKVGSGHLRSHALAHIRSNLTEHNILKELSCRLLSKHPELLEMELDTLYFHIASPLVVANFTAFAQRITKELPHGADIIYGVYTRFLKEHHPLALKLADLASLPSSSGGPEQAELNVGDASESKDEDETGSSSVDKQVTRAAGCLPSRSIESTPGIPPRAVPTIKEPNSGQKHAPDKCK